MFAPTKPEKPKLKNKYKMKKELTLEQFEQRRETNKKILKFGCLPIFIILLIIGLLSKNETQKSDSKTINMDSLCSKIKKDSLYQVTDIYYNKKDSSLSVAIVYKKKDIVSANGFYENYNLNSCENIEGVYLYKKGTSLSNVDKTKSLDYISINLAKRIKEFEDSAFEYHIKSYLEKNVNDPTDLEILNKWVLGENSDGTFAVKVTFRAKNAFGALIIHTLNCDMDKNGNGSNIEFDK